MLVSVVIRTRDEWPRLRLVLASLMRQTVPLVPPAARCPAGEVAAEVIVVDDGSADGTPELLPAEADSDRIPLLALTLTPGRGRAAASNRGAEAAAGDVLLFLDGDSLAAPDLVERHARAHLGLPAYARGENRHLRCTRYFIDPETGSPRPGCEDEVRRMGPELARNLVTRDEVLSAFAGVERRSQAGLYPGAGPRRLFEVEWDALVNHPDLGVLWMAAAGHNASVRRSDFAAAGGFDEGFSINAHRELAFRLQRAGVPVRPVPGARTYHLTHREGWRDPLEQKEWERSFFEAHPDPAVELMSVFWLSISGDDLLPPESRLDSLPLMDAAARGETGVDYGAAREAHPKLGRLCPKPGPAPIPMPDDHSTATRLRPVPSHTE